MPSGGFGFGPFRLDVRSKHLLRDGQPIALPARQFALLLELVSRAGEIVTKRRLLEVGWHDVEVTENSLVKAVTSLRAVLDADAPEKYIATVPRVGYRFIAPVTRDAIGQTDTELDTLMAPHMALVDGRAMLETLERSRVTRAVAVFEQLVAGDGRNAMFRVGLANAYVLQYEATRADETPDVESIERALVYAREARQIDSGYADAWATYGFVLGRTGEPLKAAGAIGRAMELQPTHWAHPLRLAWVTWGDARLRAAERTRELWPDMPAAYWLEATVYVARGMLAEAERRVGAALAAAVESSGFSGAALHWLQGLLCLSRGAVDEAAIQFEREIALEPRGHLYGRECSANAWYATGVMQLGRHDLAAARAAFLEAIARVPRHAMARVGLATIDHLHGGSTANVSSTNEPPTSVDLAMARAAWAQVVDDDSVAAAAIVAASLAAAPPGNAGWLIPIEPLLDVERHKDVWAPVLATLRERACVVKVSKS